MCFSAQASFISVVVLAGAGVAARRSVGKNRGLYPLAHVPFLFALQQASEGVLWLTYMNDALAGVAQAAAYGFLFFAFVLWPSWVPYSFLKAESKPGRIVLLKGLLALGALISLLCMYLLFTFPVDVHVGCNVVYHVLTNEEFHPGFYLFLYTVPTILPFFLSSLYLSRVMGIFLIVALLVTWYSWLSAFISVWCFFAAALSVFTVCIIRRNQ